MTRVMCSSCWLRKRNARTLTPGCAHSASPRDWSRRRPTTRAARRERRRLRSTHPDSAWERLRKWRSLIDQRPETSQLFYRIQELLEVDWFDDIGIDSEFITSDQVLFLPRRGQHDNGDALEFRVRLHLTKHFQAIHAGHFQVQ